VTAPYAELHVHSCFSLLDAPCHPEQLVERAAAALGYEHLALTDHDALHGVVRFVRAAERSGIHPIVGAEVTMEDGSHLTLLAEDERGYATLARLLSAARLGWPTPEGPDGTELHSLVQPSDERSRYPGSGWLTITTVSSSSPGAARDRSLVRSNAVGERLPGPGHVDSAASSAPIAVSSNSRITASGETVNAVLSSWRSPVLPVYRSSRPATCITWIG